MDRKHIRTNIFVTLCPNLVLAANVISQTLWEAGALLKLNKPHMKDSYFWFVCAFLEVVIKVQSKDSVLDDDITENKRVKL